MRFMNGKRYEIFQRYRARRYQRELENLRQSFADRGATFSSTRKDAEVNLKADYDDEIAMEREKMLNEEGEHKEQKRERNNAIHTNRVSASMAILGFILTLVFSLVNIVLVMEANETNKRQAVIEYDNAQPFLAIVGGNEDATSVRIKNVGGGPAKNIFFVKQWATPEGVRVYALTKEKDIGLVLASGSEGNVNLDATAMDQLVNLADVKERIGCITNISAIEGDVWVAALYENIRGERFISKFRGTGTGYKQGVEFESVVPCGE